MQLKPVSLSKNIRSKYVGVYYYPTSRTGEQWHSVVSVNSERMSCGYYKTEHEAVKARDLAIIRYNLKQPLQVLKKIMTYKGFEIVESSRHGKAVKGQKIKSSIQVREPMGSDGYLLKKQIPFTAKDSIKKQMALDKAKKWVDDNQNIKSINI